MYVACAKLNCITVPSADRLSVNENRVIVLSIHQPRYSIFKLFASLTLLSQGEMVYHGLAGLALDYFDRIGISDKFQFLVFGGCFLFNASVFIAYHNIHIT